MKLSFLLTLGVLAVLFAFGRSTFSSHSACKAEHTAHFFGKDHRPSDLPGPGLHTRKKRALTVLTGKVTDEKGELLVGASLKVLKGTEFVRGAITDYTGEYRINLDQDTYELECSFTGYGTKKIPKIEVVKDQITRLDITLSNTVLEEVVVRYMPPLIEQDKTAASVSCFTTSERLPKRSVNRSAAQTAGRASVDGPDVKLKGSRSNATNYYVDGIRVSGQPPAVEDIKSGKTAPARPDSIIPDPRNTEQYDRIAENPFLKSDQTPVSTFSIDVDVASYANIRRFLNYGQKPPADAVRIEEMINYFDYQYPEPKGDQPIRVVTELGVCPWAPKHHLLMIGLQGTKIDAAQLPPGNLVFLIDVSGSMNEPDKLPLVQQSLHLLTEQLRPQDRVAIVVYAGAAGLVLPGTPGDQKAAILKAIDELRPGGGTAGSAGIKLAYETALKSFLPNGNNRVILCTDGDFNVGVSSEDELVKLIESERSSGIYLTVLGFGRGNYQDGKMQMLADKGNGNHAYIDRISEARKVLVREFGSTLFTIAKDVKLQMDFNPAQVAEYRLIGYENRLLAKEDFDDDTKDAGELGAGHHVTALYEIIPQTKTLKDRHRGELVKLKFRYKPPTGNQPSRLIEQSVPAVCTASPSDNYNLAASVAEFGLLLRNSAHKGNATWVHALDQVQKTGGADPAGYRQELAELVAMAGKK